MCRKFVMCLSVLLLASSLLWAFPGRVTGSQAEKPTDTLAQEVQAEEPRTDSGGMQSEGSTEASISLETSRIEEKVTEGRRLSAEDARILYEDLVAVRADMEALRDTSKEKDEVIDKLAKDGAEAGSKAYVMVDGILGFEKMKPVYGVGLTLGARIGNSLMAELGADYMLKDTTRFDLDNLQFRAGIGWMF